MIYENPVEHKFKKEWCYGDILRYPTGLYYLSEPHPYEHSISIGSNTYGIIFFKKFNIDTICHKQFKNIYFLNLDENDNIQYEFQYMSDQTSIADVVLPIYKKEHMSEYMKFKLRYV